MNELQGAFNRYNQERPLYVAFVQAVEVRIRRACQEAGIPCSITGRAKEVDSLVKKLIRAPQAYEKVFDKAGVRVVPAYPDDRKRISEIVHATFDVSWSKDFVEDAPVDRFSYRGLHFTVGLRAADRDGVATESAALLAELQVHTMGESLWATVNHDLVYKTHQDVPSDVKRSLHRLSALLELVDMGMGEARGRILNQDGADEARILAIVEKFFLRFRAHPSDPRLSFEIVKALRPLLGDVPGFNGRIEAFVAKSRTQLEHVYAEYESDLRHLLLTQPESLLLFYLLEEDRVGLENSWPSAIPKAALEGIQSVWVPSDP